MPVNKFWDLRPSTTEEGVLNMYIYGQIKSSASFFGSDDDVVSSEFLRDLNKYPDTHTIHVHINSPGGSVFAAASIYNQLREHTATVHTWCEGICASAAVGILLAADPGCRHMSRATLLMIHNPSTEVRGDQAEMLKAADLLAKVKNTILAIYTEGTGLAKEQLSAMMDAETYLDADEAKAYNFIDSVTEDEASYDFRNEGRVICNGIEMDVAAELDLGKLQDRLAQLQNHHNKKGGKTVMSFDEYLASLDDTARALIENHIASRLQAREAELEASHGTAMQNLRNDLQGKIDDLNARMSVAQNPPPSGEEALLADVSDEVRELLAQARADALAAQQKLQEMQDAQNFAQFKETFAEFSNLPLNDEHIKALQAVSQKHPDMYAELRELLKVANVAMENQMSQVGTSQGKEVGTTAYDRLEGAINDFRQANPTASYNDAMRAVLKEHPDLYDSYREEREERGRTQ